LERCFSATVLEMSEAAVVLEGLIAARYNRDTKAHRMGPDYIVKQSRILEAATRHYLAAVRELARVRKLQAGAPATGLGLRLRPG
jgi:hypothetical protein